MGLILNFQSKPNYVSRKRVLGIGNQRKPGVLQGDACCGLLIFMTAHQKAYGKWGSWFQLFQYFPCRNNCWRLWLPLLQEVMLGIHQNSLEKFESTIRMVHFFLRLLDSYLSLLWDLRRNILLLIAWISGLSSNPLNYLSVSFILSNKSWPLPRASDLVSLV